MIGYYNPSVILTYFGLCTAVFGMSKVLGGDIKTALMCLMVCGVCDMFDGSIARRCKRNDDEKSFGIQIDSLCDLVCFGVFPAIIGFGIKNFEINAFDIFASAAYVLAAIIRLGYFNVQEINRTRNNESKREYYEGLPVTSVALLLPVFCLINVYVEPFSAGRIYSVALLIIAIAFISKFRVKKPYLHKLIIIAFMGFVIFLLIMKEGDNIAYVTPAIQNILRPMFA